jgi:hypothetical protein
MDMNGKEIKNKHKRKKNQKRLNERMKAGHRINKE